MARDLDAVAARLREMGFEVHSVWPSPTNPHAYITGRRGERFVVARADELSVDGLERPEVERRHARYAERLAILDALDGKPAEPPVTYQTLVLCPVCGRELDRQTHPEPEPHPQAVAMLANPARRIHARESPSCANDSQWQHGWHLRTERVEREASTETPERLAARVRAETLREAAAAVERMEWHRADDTEIDAWKRAALRLRDMAAEAEREASR